MHRIIPRKRIIPRLGRIRDPETGELVQGVLIRDPKTLQRLPAAGVVVDRVDAHWRRRALEGGVTIVDEPSPAPETQASTAPEPTSTASGPAPVLLGVDASPPVESRLGELLRESVVLEHPPAVAPAPAPTFITGPKE